MSERRQRVIAALVVLATAGAVLVASAEVAQAATVPGAPTILQNAVAGNQAATVSWTAPASDGGSPITGYVVTPYVGFSPMPTTTFPNALTTQVVPGLTNGTTYRFRVQAVNAVGTSGYSTTTNSVTPSNLVPSAPIIKPNAAAGNGRALVVWSPPLSDGGFAVTGYVVTPYVGFTPLPSTTVDSPATAQTVIGLTNGTTYRFRVRALNAVGTSLYSMVTKPVIPVPAPNQATALAVGGAHACAVVGGGAVRCWGDNASGQLGDGTVASPAVPDTTSVPVSVVGVTGASAVAAGDLYSCALLSGRVQCWGHNGFQELGNGEDLDSPLPVLVSGITGATAITADGTHSCALVAAGEIKCWGSNGYGQLGDGSVSLHTTPVTVTGITGATSVAAGGSHTCAVVAGAVKCWGYNAFGRLGDGTTTDSPSPVSVVGITDAVAVTAGSQHTCALLAGGALKCWGLNLNGRLGNGTSMSSSIPVSVLGITNATSVAADGSSSCARLASGGIKCWGYNGYGQLGNGSTADSAAPVGVVGIAAAIAVEGSSVHTCTAVSNGRVKCWGLVGSWLLGGGTATTTPVPVTVIGL